MGTVHRYVEAVRRWRKAGRPLRSQEEIDRIFNELCKTCEHFRESRRGHGSCGLCGCRLDVTGRRNKIAWATEWCPAGKWEADVVVDQAHARKMRSDLKRGGRSKADRAKAREARRAAREARRARRAARAARQAELPGIIAPTRNKDPLVMYDRAGQKMGHAMRDMWARCPAFLVGGGPSLRDIDLSFLRDRGVVSLGINNVAGYAPVRAMTFSDPPDKFHHGIFLDPAIIKFVPKPKLNKRVRAKLPSGEFRYTAFRVSDCPSVFGYLRGADWDPESFLTSENATWGCNQNCHKKRGREKILFTFFLGLRLLHYLGVRRVYLIGVDFRMLPGATGGYAFDERRTAGAAAGNNDHYRKAAAMCEELAPVFRRRGFEVLNCNPQSGLRVWPFVKLEDAIADCKRLIGPEPFDLSGWYSKDEKDRVSG